MDIDIRSTLMWVGGIAALILVLAVVGGGVIYDLPAKPGWAGVADKTFWNWLQFLIILFVLAIGGIVGGYFFTRSQNRTARAIAERRAQDEALQTYLDNIGESLLDRENALRDSGEGDEVRILARARTMTALKRLDGDHNRTVLRFLRESQLVGDRSEPIISFIGADLTDVDLRGTDLRSINLRDADLSRADLRDTNLRDTDLRHAILMVANLRGADLRGADLRGAVLLAADIGYACLIDAQVTEEQLAYCRFLKDAIMPKDTEHD